MQIAIGSSGIHVKAQGGLQNPLPKGHVTSIHEHPFAHVTMVFAGFVLAEWMNADGTVKKSVELRAPAFVEIPAHTLHRMTVLKAGSIYWCVFAERDPVDGSVAGRRTGWEGAWQS